MTTAKSILLLDASGLNISPITDITSLYYEVSTGDNIVARKYVYSGFPVSVNIDSSINSSIGVLTSSVVPDISLYIAGNLKKIVDENKQDIYVSNVSVGYMPGTTYRLLEVKNYNLSKILTNYTPIDLLNASISAVNSSIRIINNNIDNINSSISLILPIINNTAFDMPLSELITLANNSSLIPNKFYIINNYWQHATGCFDIPNSSFSGNSTPLKVLVKANAPNSLENKVYEIYNSNGIPLKVYGNFDIIGNSSADSSLRITYLKDLYGNEAPYDFYNLYYNIDNRYYKTFNHIGNNNHIIVKNNVIKTNPFINKFMPVFYNYNNDGRDFIIENNYIGHNNNIFIESGDDELVFENNIIKDSNYINITGFGQGEAVNIQNTIINDNNYITYHNLSAVNYNYISIGNNNIINLSEIVDIHNLTINSSNNLVLVNNINNGIILNNCDSKIYLSDNIIIDNYINTTALHTSSNCVYLFGQNVYAKSFNTLR